jgi:hypothetical protein
MLSHICQDANFDNLRFNNWHLNGLKVSCNESICNLFIEVVTQKVIAMA